MRSKVHTAGPCDAFTGTGGDLSMLRWGPSSTATTSPRVNSNHKLKGRLSVPEVNPHEEPTRVHLW